MSIGLFIDGAYLLKTFKDHIDYVKLIKHIEETLGDTVDEGYFFNADTDPPKAEKLHNALTLPLPRGPGLRVKTYWLQTKQIFWPKQLGGQPVTHPDNPEIQYEQTTQKAVDVGLVYHMVRSYHKRKWTKLVLIAGDGDFHEPVQGLVESENVDLYLVGSIRNISTKIRPYARNIFEIDQEPLHSQLLQSTSSRYSRPKPDTDAGQKKVSPPECIE